MPDDDRALERRRRRVAGMIVYMLGAGVMLDSAALWTGLTLFVAGLALWASSFMAKAPPDVLAERPREES